ncbi:MAG: methionyl-tRNA formyltransferase [Bacteroidota bacterium]
MDKKDFRIIFMGTPDFAVESLKILTENNYNIVAVVTNPDKPAGRGQKIKESAVKKYAVSQGLHVLQPANLKDEQFREEISKLQPSLQVVVAFKILPPSIFTIPTFGTFNLHASLLPQYRGAAPINHAIINGEKETGVTTFFLDEKVDTGKIIDQRKVSISETDTAGTLHDKLMNSGAELVKSTIDSIINRTYSIIPQDKLAQNFKELKKAPKIFNEDCRINWNSDINELHNFIRGLSPYPAAWTEFIDVEGNRKKTKIFFSEPITENHNYKAGTILSDQKTYLKVAAKNGFISIKKLQSEGKKKMQTEEFLRGIRSLDNCVFK